MLLTKANLTLEQALEISQGMETATLESKELKGSQWAGAVLTVGAPESSSVLTVGVQRNLVVVAGVELTLRKPASSVMLPEVGHIAPVCRSKVAEKPARRYGRKN